MSMATAREVQAELNKAFGDGTIKLGSEVGPVTHWSTGILPVDVMLDGGLPVGRFTEVYGDYSTLKSYLGYKTIAEVQKRKGTTALVDAEHAYEAEWAAELGVNTKDLLVMRPDTGEEAVSVMEVLIRKGYDFIMWDSIASSQPKQYQEKMPGEDNQPGGLARMMSAALRRMTSANTHTSVLAINQTRTNIGMTYGGATESVPGGRSMPFYASYRLQMRKAGKVREETETWNGEKMIKVKRTTKQKIRCTLEKSKLNRPEQEVWIEFDLTTGQVDEVSYIVGWGIENGIIETYGNGGYKMELEEGELKERGREKFMDALREETELVEWFRSEMTTGFSMASPGGTVPVKSKGARQSKSSPESED